MKRLGEHPFHTLLVLTEKPIRWQPWQIAPGALVLVGVAGLAWSTAAHQPGAGWAVAGGLLVIVLLDWALLASLPRRGISFGAVQPPWLGLFLVRWLLAMLATLPARHWPLPTMLALATAQVATSLVMAYGTHVEPFRLQVTHLELPSTRLANPGTPLRIVHLSDLHVERLTRRERALAEIVAGLAPDLVVLTGDLLSTSYNDDPRALADLRMLLGQIHAPAGVYAVWGTVEVDLPHLLRPLLQACGVVVLEDRAVQIVAGDHRLWLMGVSCRRDLDADGGMLGALLAKAPPDAFTLLLHHTPDLMPEAVSLGVDLYLAGHTHGGQWRLPGFGAMLTSSRYWKRYEAGHYHAARTHLYVSRGLGMEGFGTPRARFFCPPEIVCLTLVGAQEGE
jgi:predicted MPP superfamily phosphohydrolase